MLYIHVCVGVLTVHPRLCRCPYCTSTAVSVSLLYIRCCVGVLTVHPLLCRCPYCTSTAVSVSLLYIHVCVGVLPVHPRLCRCPYCTSTYCTCTVSCMSNLLPCQCPACPPFPNRRAVGPSGFRATSLKMDRVLDCQQRSYPVHCFTPPFGLTHFRKNA